MRKVFINALLVLFCAGCFHVSSVLAQDTNVLENYRVDMPNVLSLSDEELQTRAQPYEEVPFNEKTLAFKIMVPHQWKNRVEVSDDEDALSNKVLGDLAKFYGPPRIITERSFLTISASNLEYEMSAEHWVLRYLLSRGLTPKGMNAIDRNRVEFFFVTVDGDTTYGIRSVAQVNGKRVLLVQYHLPLEAWDEEKQLQASVVQSLEVVNPVVEDVEEMIEYRFLDVAKLKYPDSWKLKAPTIRTIDKMKIQIMNYNDNSNAYSVGQRPTLDGKVEAFLYSYFAFESIDDERELLQEELKDTGLVLGQKIDSSEDRLDNYFKNHEDFDSYDLTVFKAKSLKNKTLGYEFWISSFESGDYFYFFTLLTPSRDDDFFIWSRNKETYDLIMKSFNPNLESLLYEE